MRPRSPSTSTLLARSSAAQVRCTRPVLPCANSISTVAVSSTVEIEFAQGRTGRVHLTWAAEERANSVEVEGERGRIRIAGASVILDGPSGERRWNCPPALSEGSHHPDRFERVALEFTEAVAGRSRGNLDEAVLCARLIDLARASNAAGGARMALDGPDAVRRLEAVEH